MWVGSATTDATGFYSVSGAPATTHGVLVGTTGSDEWPMSDLTFADPGTSTYDVRLGRVAWSATRGGPLAASWQDPLIIWITGTSATGSQFAVVNWAPTSTPGGSSGATVTGTASALPGDVRWMGFWFGTNEAAEWDASDPGNAPVPVTAGSTTPLPFTFDEASAYRVLRHPPLLGLRQAGNGAASGAAGLPRGDGVHVRGQHRSRPPHRLERQELHHDRSRGADGAPHGPQEG